MVSGFDYAMAFVTGILGAPHCIGMCSGITGAFLLRSRQTLVLELAMYHGTRVLVYVLVGVSGALLTRVLEQTGLFGKGQGLLMIVAGIAIVLLAAVSLLRTRTGERSAGSCRITAGLRQWGGVLPAVGGLINGLIPCSLVFSVAIKASMTAPLNASLLMFAFGLGTLPGVMPASLLAVLARRRPGTWFRIAAACVVALGVKTVYEGMVFFNIMRGLAN